MCLSPLGRIQAIGIHITSSGWKKTVILNNSKTMIAQEHLEGLGRLATFTSLMAGSSSSLKKKEILLDHSRDAFIIKAMEYTYNPYKKFGVHKKTADKNSSLSADIYSDLWGMLDDLNERRITGHDAIAAVNGFTSQLGAAESNMVFAILDGDLKMRASGTLINDVIPGTIPTFSVALAQAYEPKHADFDSETWYGSRKLDGCLHESTIVEFDDGRKISIKEVVDNRISGNVKSYNTQTKKIEYKSIRDWMVNLEDINDDNKEWFEITLENDRSLILTGNHRIWLPELRCWRRVDELDGNETFLLT
jgi:Fe-S-cluster formation regulator IscX/YfhJ